ncbi:MAG: hypothetical protein V1659_03100 [Candidatus Woesearchaeota archaeon]
MAKELTRIIEDAKSGRTADLIRGIDLSTKEGVKKLKTILSPFSNFGEVRIPYDDLRANRILDTSGNPVFPFQCRLSTPEHLLSDYPLGLTEMLERIGDKTEIVYPHMTYKSILDKHLLTNGHEMGKVPYTTIDALGINRRGGGSGFVAELLRGSSALDGLKELLAEMFVGGNLVSLSLNGSLPSAFISSWVEDKRYPPRPEHPNSQGVAQLLNFNERYFTKWNEVFLRYLSNIIQNPCFGVSKRPTTLSREQIIADASCIGGRGYIFRQDEYMQDDNFEKSQHQTEKGRGSEYCKDIEEEVNLMLTRFAPYEKSLDESLENMRFAEHK